MKVITNKFGKINVRWQYGIWNGDREITKAFLEKDKEIVKEISVLKHPKEKNDKLLAREYAFATLIQNSFSRNSEDLKDRKTMWEVFKEKIKRKNKTKESAS